MYDESDDESIQSNNDDIFMNDDDFIENDDDDEPQIISHRSQPQPNLFNRFGDIFNDAFNSHGFGGHAFGRPPASTYDQFFKAYSVAMMGGNERPNLQYGGKIIMPQSALARLTNLEIESPWTFQLISPKAPSNKTHAGVLEFIADEGNVHLPAWMMRQLQLDEGDPIRITGAALPKGKFTKLQAQTTDFLEISDHKTVLEKALRNFSTLTKVMEIEPEGDSQSIFIIDTDLEVDFAPPKGYVEPPRKPLEPPPTMASKLNIDTRAQDESPSGSRPHSTTPSFEVFRGSGQTLGGRKTKGKGLSKAIETVDESSKINRTDKSKQVTADTLEDGKKVPAALNLPFGKLFFGFDYVPIGGNKPKNTNEYVPFGGTTGVTLSGRNVDAPAPQPSTSNESKNEQANNGINNDNDPWSKLGTGNSLSQKRNNSRDVIDIDSD